MKAPDKIYLHGYPDKPFLCQDWDVSPTKRVVRGQQAENIAYIRKEALLEYLTGRKKELLSGESFVAGERKMLKEIIDKIESL